MVAVSQAAFASHGDRSEGRSFFTPKSCVRYRVRAGERGGAPVLLCLAAAFVVGLAAVCVTAALVLSRSQSVLVSVEAYPGPERGSLLSLHSLAVRHQQQQRFTFDGERAFVDFQFAYFPKPPACKAAVRRLGASALSEAGAVVKLILSLDGPVTAALRAAVPVAADGGQGELELLARFSAPVSELCPGAMDDAVRVLRGLHVNGSDAARGVTQVLLPAPGVPYLLVGDRFAAATTVPAMVRCADALWARAAAAPDARLAGPEAGGACEHMEQRTGLNPYIVERRQNDHTRGEVAALTLSYALAYCGAAAVALKVAAGALLRRRREAEKEAAAAAAGPALSRRHLVTPVAAINHAAAPGNDFALLNAGGVAVGVVAAAAAAAAWAYFAGAKTVSSSLGPYDDSASSNSAVGLGQLTLDIHSGRASEVYLSFDGTPFEDDPGCRALVASLAAPSVTDGAETKVGLQLDAASAATTAQLSFVHWPDHASAPVTLSQMVFSTGEGGRVPPPCSVPGAWDAFSPPLFASIEPNTGGALILYDNGTFLSTDGLPPAFDLEACEDALGAAMASALLNATAAAEACARAEHLPPTETLGGSWLRTFSRSRGAGDTALLAANVGFTAAILAGVVLRTLSRLRWRRKGGGGESELAASLLDPI